MIGTQNCTIDTMDATIITNNDANALLLAIGDEAKKALLQLPWRITELADACCTHLRGFANKQSITITKDMLDDVVVAIVLISDGHEESFSLAHDIGLIMKAAGICSVGIVTIDRTSDEEEAEDPIDETGCMTPAELILEPLISCFDCFIFSSIAEGGETTAVVNAFADATTLLLRFLLYESENERSKNIENIRESGIAYYDSAAFADEWDIQAAASQLVFRLLFASPIYAAGAVFATIRHGSNFHLASSEENDDDDGYLFSYLEDHLDADAYYCTKCSEDQALQPYDLVVSVLTCRFDGQSTLFDERGAKQYPEIRDRRLRKRIDRASNYPFFITKRRAAYENYCKERALMDHSQYEDDE